MFFCPKCKEKTKVLETRFEDRRRNCNSCDFSFWTTESVITEIEPGWIAGTKIKIKKLGE